jgi:hypothetical protein
MMEKQAINASIEVKGDGRGIQELEKTVKLR